MSAILPWRFQDRLFLVVIWGADAGLMCNPLSAASKERRYADGNRFANGYTEPDGN